MLLRYSEKTVQYMVSCNVASIRKNGKEKRLCLYGEAVFLHKSLFFCIFFVSRVT